MGTGTVCKVQKVFGRISQHHGFNKKNKGLQHNDTFSEGTRVDLFSQKWIEKFMNFPSRPS